MTYICECGHEERYHSITELTPEEGGGEETLCLGGDVQYPCDCDMYSEDVDSTLELNA